MTARVHARSAVSVPRRRNRLMLSCAAAAIAMASSQQVAAQAFQGAESVVAGTAVRNITSPTSETITVGTPSATINWTPTDNQGAGPIDFLPAGNTATFTNDPQATSDFTVLNRILPADRSRPVALNGRVITQLQTITESVSTGGSVWFYTPGGLIIGSSAVFDVGGLLLTANDPVSFTAGSGSFSGRFLTDSASNARVQIQSGARIDALTDDSYVAIVAPRLEQSGSIRVDGSAALVAAQDATLTMNQGLFDIQIGIGTNDANGIVHDGSTGGPASSGAGDNHRIYMVAVPKNQALTMLLGGDVGFAAANDASIQNGVVILSAGTGVDNNVFGTDAFTDDHLGGAVAGTPADMQIAGGSFTSSVIGGATGNINAAGGGGTLAFAQDVSLQALQSTILSAGDGETVTVGGSAAITANDTRNFTVANAEVVVPLDAQGGTASITAGQGGSIQIAGNATVAANATAAYNSITGEAGTAQGGTATLESAGAVTITGDVDITAAGVGGRGGTGGAGGAGAGGSAYLGITGGTASIGGTTDVVATGTGGNSDSGSGGEGRGGFGMIYVNDASLSLAAATVSTSGTGGNGQVGGRAEGGVPTVIADEVSPDRGSFLSVRNGAITGDTLVLSSTATGGRGSAGAGGNAVGGLTSVTALNGTSTGLIDINNVTVVSDAAGGWGGSGGNGGIGQAGEAHILARAVNGTVTIDTATIHAIGTGGQGGDGLNGATGGAGGAGYGGFSNFGTSSGLMTTPDRDGVATLNSVSVDVTGYGGSGGSGGSGGVGGTGIGGAATLLARGSEVHAGAVVIAANGEGGLGGLLENSDSRASAGTGIGGGAGILATNIFEGEDRATVDVSSFTGSASGVAVTGGAMTQAGEVSIEATNSSITIGSVEMMAAGAQQRNYSGVDADGDAFTLTPAPASVRATNGAVRVIGNANIITGAPLAVEVDSAGQVDVQGNFALTSTATSGDGLSLTAHDGGSVSVGTQLFATSADGVRVVAEGSGQVSAGRMTLTSSGADGIEVGSVDGGTIHVADLLSATAEGISGQVRMGAIASPEALAIAAAEGPITSHDVSLTTGGDIVVSDVAASGTVTMVYGDDLTIGDLSAAESIQARLAAVLDPESHHDLLIEGLVSAPTISLESGTIGIASDGSLGEPGVTDTLELIARSFGQPIIIGGADHEGDAEGQYHLTQADGGRIEAATVRFRGTANGNAVPHILVRDLTIQGTQGGGASIVELNTEGTVRIEGDLSYIDAAASDALRITAGERLEVITPDGSIHMVDSDGDLSGVLTLQSSNVVVTDAALAQRLADDATFSGRDQALKTNSGPVNAAGYLEAGGIRLLTNGNIFIQNSGTATEFAGLTVGGQGLLVGRYQAATNPDGLQTFSFTGTLTTANDVLRFDFSVTGESEITLRTYSYAGGTNGEGEQIASGGFDPILALFDAAGVLIGQNDDGGNNVPADPNTGSHYDTFFQALLPAGDYTVTVMAYSNFANGPNISDGFDGGGSFGNRTPDFAFDVIGADTVTGPGGNGPVTVIGFGRRQNADGSFTSGNDFFAAADFGTGNGVEYVQGSIFNNCPIGGACAVVVDPDPDPGPGPDPDPEPFPQVPPQTTSGGVVLGPIEILTSGGDDADEPGGSAVNTTIALIGGSTGANEGVLDEATTSGGDTTLWIHDDQDCSADKSDGTCPTEDK